MSFFWHRTTRFLAQVHPQPVFVNPYQEAL